MSYIHRAQPPSTRKDHPSAKRMSAKGRSVPSGILPGIEPRAPEVPHSPTRLPMIALRRMQHKTRDELQKVLQSGMRPAVVLSCLRGERSCRPPWNKRHHIIEPLHNGGRCSLPLRLAATQESRSGQCVVAPPSKAAHLSRSIETNEEEMQRMQNASLHAGRHEQQLTGREQGRFLSAGVSEETQRLVDLTAGEILEQPSESKSKVTSPRIHPCVLPCILSEIPDNLAFPKIQSFGETLAEAAAFGVALNDLSTHCRSPSKESGGGASSSTGTAPSDSVPSSRAETPQTKVLSSSTGTAPSDSVPSSRAETPGSQFSAKAVVGEDCKERCHESSEPSQPTAARAENSPIARGHVLPSFQLEALVTSAGANPSQQTWTNEQHLFHQSSDVKNPSQQTCTAEQRLFHVSSDAARSKENADDENGSAREHENGGSTSCLVPFTEEEKSVLRGFFDLHDTDGSSSLSLAELVAVVGDIGRAPSEGGEDALQFKRLMSKADLDHSEELDFEEFASFLAEYYQSVYERLFLESDIDRSGTITTVELKRLMVKLQENGFKIRGEDIATLFTGIDQGNDEILGWREFLNFMCGYRRLEFELLKVSAGFHSTELEYLETIFNWADADSSGQLAIKEVVELLEKTLLGSKVDTQEEIDEIVKLFSRMDKDESMTLDFMEFLRLLRVWSNNSGKRGGKQKILQTLKDAKVAQKGDAGTLRKRARTSAVVSGLDEDTAAKVEMIAENLRVIAVQHDVEDGVLVTQNHLTIQEVRCLRESFEFCDADGSGHIDREELTIVLKNLGCAATTASQKKAFFKTLERDEFSGNLEFPFLVRFLVAYHRACAEEILLSIKNDGGEEGVPVEKLVQALYQIGQYLNKNGITTLLRRVGVDPDAKIVDKSTFLKMLELDRYDKTLAWREKCGFSDSQLSAIKHAFLSFSDHEDGTIMNRDGRVLEALHLLNLAPPLNKRDELMRALLRVDREGEGTITFHDFLLLVRHLENQKVYARTQEEIEKAKIAGLDADAVQQIRQVFNDYEPNDSGKVCIPKIQMLFLDLGLVQNTKQRRHLQDVINNVTGNDNSGLEFSQFLDILHQLENAGIC